ncbi:DnaB-like helicase C-terminal domain-containing protein, partial [Bacillus altitudinis]|uniref:DnaB-like helicase C-terminal domain-containing protein n=1 Tax=Bacillus altitudinis TaxID=293387 RepID=UPI003B52A0F7
MTSAFHPQQFIILPPPPSLPKTPFCFNLPSNFIQNPLNLPKGAPLGIFSLEMSPNQLIKPIQSTIPNINPQSIPTTNLNPHHCPTLTKLNPLLHSPPLT